MESIKCKQIHEDDLTIVQQRYLAYSPFRYHLKADEYREFLERIAGLPNVWDDFEVSANLLMDEMTHDFLPGEAEGEWSVTYHRPDNDSKHTVIDADLSYAVIWALINAHHIPDDNGYYDIPEIFC